MTADAPETVRIHLAAPEEAAMRRATARVADILQLGAARNRPLFARHIALETDLDPEAAEAALEASPLELSTGVRHGRS